MISSTQDVQPHCTTIMIGTSAQLEETNAVKEHEVSQRRVAEEGLLVLEEKVRLCFSLLFIEMHIRR